MDNDDPATAAQARERFFNNLPHFNEMAAVPMLVGSPGFDLADLNGLISIQHGAQPGTGFSIAWNGEDNHVLAPPDFKPNALRIIFSPQASGNLVVLTKGSNVFGEFKFHGSDSIAIFSPSGRAPSAIILAMQGHANTFFWGRESSSNGLSVFVQGDRRSVVIGEDCMVAQRVSVMTSDMHAVVDLETGAWLNDGAPIVIEPHVWLGWESMVMKGTTIGFGATIAARSVVTHDVPRFAISGGTPNQTIRKNSIWTRPAIPLLSALAEVYGLAERSGVKMGQMPHTHASWQPR
jgi:acetyltransferase-like isoleucine patch superfamily enzyme